MLAIARIRTGARFLFWMSRPRPRAGDHPADRPHHRAAEVGGFTILLSGNFRFASTVADRYYIVEHGR